MRDLPFISRKSHCFDSFPLFLFFALSSYIVSVTANMHLTVAAGIVAAALAVVYIFNQIREILNYRARARELGCESPPWMSTFDPTGISELAKGIKASRRKQFPTYMQEKFEREAIKYGRTVGTFRFQSPFFRETIVTIEPRNIQTILALKFKDFGLGINRTDNFEPLLGHGIVSFTS